MAGIKGQKMNKKSFEEKKNIVLENLNEGLTFKELSSKHGVSYSAVRKWCLDYDIYGDDILRVEQGKGKTGIPGTKMRSTSLDPKDREIARLRKELKQAEMRETIAKKFNEAMEKLQKELSTKN